jgi:hypothetical protein
MLASAQAQAPATPDSLLSVGAIPLASAEGYNFPRDYPCLDVGVGLHTFSPDLSSLVELYDGVRALGLRPVVCGVVEIACSDALGIQVDAGKSLDGFQGMAGLVYYFRPFSNPDLRPCLSAGVTICSFHAREPNIITRAGARGFYARAGFEFRLGRSGAVAFYAGYCSYPRISAIFTPCSAPADQGIDVSVDPSSAIVGFQLKGLM